MHIDLNIFKTNIVSDLQQMYSGGNTRNSAFSTISKANYKEKLFPYCECLYADIKDTG